MRENEEDPLNSIPLDKRLKILDAIQQTKSLNENESYVFGIIASMVSNHLMPTLTKETLIPTVEGFISGMASAAKIIEDSGIDPRSFGKVVNLYSKSLGGTITQGGEVVNE